MLVLTDFEKESLNVVLSTDPDSVGVSSALKMFTIEDLMEIVKENYRLDRSGEGEPYLSDPAFDALVKYITEAVNSNFQNELESLTYEDSFQLPVPMPGISQIYNDSDISKWAELVKESGAADSENILFTAKHDGISAELIYHNGALRQAYSKYTGFEGKDIFRNILGCPKVPVAIPLKGKVAIRGELEMLNSVFLEKYQDSWKTPRNMVSGLFRRKKRSEELADVNFIGYEIFDISEDIQQQIPNSRKAQLDLLSDMGFEVPYHFMTPIAELLHNTYDFEQKIIDQLLKLRSGELAQPYAYDGWVLEVDDDSIGMDMGLESNGLYRNSRRKYKLSQLEEVLTSEVIKVDWRLHKDGHFRGCVVFEPQLLQGVSVSQASIFNAYFVANGHLKGYDGEVKPIGKGAIIKVKRSGDVIPYIVEIVKPAEVPDLPKEEDWGPVGWDESGLHMITLDPSHPEVRLRKAIRFFSCLGVNGFGVPTIRKLFELGYDSIEAILDLVLNHVWDLQGVEGFGTTSIRALQDNMVAATTEVWYPNYLAALDCFGLAVGITRLQGLYDAYGLECMEWQGYTEQDIYSNVVELPDFGELTARSFAQGVPTYFKLDALYRKFLTFQQPQENTLQILSNKLANTKVVLTGIRDSDLESLILQHGGELGTWNNSNLIIAKDPSIMRPKISKLLDKGAKIISYSEFKNSLM